MITTKIKLMDGKTVRLGGPPSFERRQMLALGLFAVNQIKSRVKRSVGSDDSPFKPLSKGYAIQKTKAGHGNRRDMTFSGEMLNAFSVRYADASQVRMDITTTMGRIKAWANEERTPWYGFSRFDQAAIIREAQKEFSESIVNFGARLRGQGSAASRTAWAREGGWNFDA
jgi:hypothetical protein